MYRKKMCGWIFMQHLSDSDTKRKRLWSKQWCIVFCALSFALSQNLRPHAPAAGVLFTPLCITRHTTEIGNNTAKTYRQNNASKQKCVQTWFFTAQRAAPIKARSFAGRHARAKILFFYYVHLNTETTFQAFSWYG